MVASDGVDVDPVSKSRFLFGIAETYDFIVTIPDGTLEIIATAQDGSGHTSIHLGKGTLNSAQKIGRPDKVEMMKQMASMDMKMGAPALVFNQKKNPPKALKNKYGMKMDMNVNHIRPVSGGFVAGKAEIIHRGRKTHVWKVDVHTEDAKLVATGRITILITDRPG